MDPAADGPPSHVAGVVLAGGGSRRLGRDKLVEVVGDATVLDRTVAAVAAATAEVVVVGPAAPHGAGRTIETRRGQGPLVALVAGLEVVSRSHVVVVAGDQAAVRTALVRLLAAQPDVADVVVPVLGGVRQPLLARYRRSVLDVARRLIAEGERSVRSLLDTVTVVELAEAEWRGVDPDGRSFLDVDTEADLAAVRTLLADGDQPPSATTDTSAPGGSGP